MKGNLVLERTPVCPGDDSAVYICSSNDGSLEWSWTTLSGSTEDISLISGRTSAGVIPPLSLEGFTIVLNVTVVDVTSSYIEVTATVRDPHNLNGTMMSCNRQSLTIIIKPMCKLKN